MSRNSDNFISETFNTSDGRFAFQKVGKYYRLYDRNIDWYFSKEFTSFKEMQDFMNEERYHAEEEKRNVR